VPLLEIIILLTLAAFIAGYVDAIAGGGGLITVPALMLAGLSPVEAIATNKLQGTAGVAASTFAFWKAGHLDTKALRRAIPAAAIGAAVGCLLVGALDATLLKRAIPVALILIALYFAFQRPASQQRATQHRTEPHDAAPPTPLSPTRTALVAFPVAAYDGFLGPGAGSFYMAGLTSLAHAPLLSALANTKPLNLTSNAVALVIFALSGNLVLWAGLPMALAQFAGSRLGAASALRHGAPLIRPAIVTVSLLLAARLLWTA
jgi:uncharacterized protein